MLSAPPIKRGFFLPAGHRHLMGSWLTAIKLWWAFRQMRRNNP